MGWGGVLYTAIGASLIGHAGMYYLLQRYDVSVTAPLTLMAPIFGIVFGVHLFGAMNWASAFGLAACDLMRRVDYRAEKTRGRARRSRVVSVMQIQQHPSPNHDARSARRSAMIIRALYRYGGCGGGSGAAVRP